MLVKVVTRFYSSSVQFLRTYQYPSHSIGSQRDPQTYPGSHNKIVAFEVSRTDKQNNPLESVDSS